MFRFKPGKALPAVLLLTVLVLILLPPGCGSETAPSSPPSSPGEQAPQDHSLPDREDLPPAEAVEPGSGAEPGPAPPRVGLYRGVGTWPPNVEATANFLDYYGYNWTFIDEKELRAGNLGESFNLLWFPGGFAAEYKNLMGGHDELRAFVDDGGAFVGSCAGAYYAAAILRWKGTDYSYPLGLFPGTADGPLAGPFAYGEGAEIVLEGELPFASGFEPSLKMRYMDGPRFLTGDESAVTVLGRYQFSGDPAVIAGRHGTGRYLLLGPHPEMGGRPEPGAGYDLTGGESAQWPWLQAALSWFYRW